MRLQRLELSGFKSFPDRADLGFEDGVTAIVGPNGCGKSNLVDAITWVLGEQSAKSLRGDRMEDVIFGGSDARKPTGAAEVRLRFTGVPVRKPALALAGVANGGGNGELDLEDLDEPLMAREVEVARRLYRSGESEYLIDGHVCRLRDVQDLLMDVGLGIKGYAVIEQGKIGQILSARPAERRQLIEEAAGVTKYKTRRRAAELKLEAAQQNLTRIDDIVYELGRQRGSLKRQAAKARRYRRLREELRRWEKVLFAQRYRVLGEVIDRTRRDLSDAREREALASARVGELEGDLERLRIELAEADERATALREQAHASELENERRQQQIDFDRQQVDQLEALLGGIRAELETLQARRDPARAAIDARRASSDVAGQERDRAAEALEQEEAAYLRSQQELTSFEAAVDAARGDVFAGLHAVTALKHAIERAAEVRERLAQERERLDVEDAELEREASRLGAQRAEIASALHAAQGALERARAARASRESELAGRRIEREWRANEVRTRDRELAALAGRLRSLEEIEAARAGYADGARLLLTSGGGTHPYEGSVADHLEADPAYDRAIEAALGERLQYLVVRDWDDASSGLTRVKAENAGRCGFVVAAGARGAVAATAPVDGLVPMASVLRVSGPSADAIREAVGEVWLAPSFEAAAAAARRTTAPLVTPDGDLFRDGVILVGGGREGARGILATKRDIKELRHQVEHEKDAVAALSQEIAAFEREITQGEHGLDALDGEVHQHEKAILGYELQQTRVDDEIERVARRRELMAAERRRADEERAALDGREGDARHSIAQHEVRQRDLDARFALAQQRFGDAREAHSSRGRVVAEAKATHAALVERAAAVEAEVTRLEEAARELDARIVAREDERERTLRRREELQRAVAENRTRLDQDLQAYLELRERVVAADERAAALHATLDEGDQRAREARQARDAARGVVSELDVRRATAEADLGHLLSACQESLQMSLDAAVADVARMEADGVALPPVASEGDEMEEDEVGDEDSLAGPPAEAEAGQVETVTPGAPSTEEVIARLKQKIERLGPVNMMAIEQFDELETRHQFLTAQRADLVESIAQTGEAIKRIDQTTKERFAHAFHAINGFFDETFRTLFGGGKSGLVLLDEEDLLESGIDIIAQPPGKRLQSVQLLSGGEKALTAIALMFGIFRFRPSPFCLLDEIDAPLDDANVARFVDMLRGMLDRTQFILVTHHRRTMEIADRLYGVTMEEPGVSKLISVQLN